MTLSRRGDYVVRAAIALAAAWDGAGAYRKTRQVAEEMALPPSYTPEVLGILARAGLAEAKAGRSGGYRLTKPPRYISLLEVIESAEGSLEPRRCAIRGGPCRGEDLCALHPAVARAAEAIRATLATTTLAEVAAADPGSETSSASTMLADPDPRDPRVGGDGASAG